jgi:hypothetical protein
MVLRLFCGIQNFINLNHRDFQSPRQKSVSGFYSISVQLLIRKACGYSSLVVQYNDSDGDRWGRRASPLPRQARLKCEVVELNRERTEPDKESSGMRAPEQCAIGHSAPRAHSAGSC